MKSTLLSESETVELIRSGKPLLLAGDEALLARLPEGRWIGGSIPYFMAEQGGTFSREQVFATEVPAFVTGVEVKSYGADEIGGITADAPEYGVSVTIIPAGSAAHLSFAEKALGNPELALKPVVGWIAGVAVEDIGKASAAVFDGTRHERLADRAVVMHLGLPADKLAHIDIVNVFRPSEGAAIRFEKTGFSAKEALVDGKKVDFAGYLKEVGHDVRLPLVADCNGAMLNVSFQSVDADKGVELYAPVFPEFEYRLARPIESYVDEFAKAVPSGLDPAFSCNCILNYLHGELQGRKTGTVHGPITFGEIAYMLLNQTLVYLDFKDA